MTMNNIQQLINEYKSKQQVYESEIERFQEQLDNEDYNDYTECIQSQSHFEGLLESTNTIIEDLEKILEEVEEILVK